MYEKKSFFSFFSFFYKCKSQRRTRFYSFFYYFLLFFHSYTYQTRARFYSFYHFFFILTRIKQGKFYFFSSFLHVSNKGNFTFFYVYTSQKKTKRNRPFFPFILHVYVLAYAFLAIDQHLAIVVHTS